MDSNGYSLADISAVASGNGGMFGNEGMWIFALLILLFGGGFNGFGNRGGEQYATTSDVQRGFDTNAIEQQIRGITYGLSDLGYALNNAIDGAKDNINANLGGVKDQVVSEGRSLQGQIADCCCTTQRNIDSVRFDMANYHADTNAVTIAQTQKILDALAQGKIDSLQAQVNQLTMQAQLCGIPKISTYAWGTYPYNAFGCGCGNNGNI